MAKIARLVRGIQTIFAMAMESARAQEQEKETASVFVILVIREITAIRVLTASTNLTKTKRKYSALLAILHVTANVPKKAQLGARHVKMDIQQAKIEVAQM